MTYKFANFPDTSSYYIDYVYYGISYTHISSVVYTKAEYTGNGYSIVFNYR